MLVIGILSFIVGQWLTEIMAFGMAIFSVSVGILVWSFIDDFILGKVNTYEQIIEKQNLAYAIFTVGIIFIVTMCLFSAFAVFIAFRL